MAVPDETRRSLDRDADGFCRAFESPVPVLSKTSEAPVVAVHDDGTVDVGYGGAVLTVRMTTACAGVAVGDTVLLTAYGQMLYATGVLARDNGHYVKVAHGKTDLTFANGSNVARAFVSADFTPTTIIACPAGAMPGYSCSTQIYDDGRAEIVMFRSGTSGQVTRAAFWALFA